MGKAISSDRCLRSVALGGLSGGIGATVLSLTLMHMAYAGQSDAGYSVQHFQLAQQNSADSAATGETGATGEVASPHYLIGPGDTIELKVLRNPDLSGTYIVRPDGRVSTPLIEDLQIVGHTPTTLSRELEERLSVYVQDPIVTVIVRSFAGDLSQQIRVVGAASRPRALPFRDRMTVMDVIIAVGGLSANADGNSAVLVRRDGEEQRQIALRLDDLVDDGDPSANVAMAPGDVIIIPEGFFSGDWRVTPTVSFEETFTDNVDLDPDGEEESAFISTVRPGITVVADAARLRWAFNGDVGFSHQSDGEDKGMNVDVDLNSTGNVEVLEDLFFIDGRASVSQEVLNSEEASSGSQDNNTNRETVQNYQLSPYLTNRLGDFALAETRYRFSQIFVDSEDASDTTRHEGSFNLASGPDFTVLGWNLSLSASEARPSDDDDISRRDANFSTTYALTRAFFLLGSIGYQQFDDGDPTNEIDDPTWRVGARWRPSPRTQLEVGYGHRDDEDSFDGSLRHDLSPRTRFTASYSEALRTSQEQLGFNLDRIEFNPETGQFEDSETGEVVSSVNDLPFEFSDETIRVSTFRMGLNGSRHQNTFGINFRAQFEDSDQEDEDRSEYALTANWGRRLNTRTNFFLNGEYEYDDADDSGIENEYTLRTGLSYRLYDRISANVSYAFRLREADDTPEDEFTENAVTVGLRASF